MKTMKSKHYIYEIFGVKIGATNDVERRIKQQGAKEGEYRIIEEHTNAKICSIREIELQKKFNYPVDKIQYWKTLKMQKKGVSPAARKKAVANTDYKQVFENRKGKIDYSKNTLSHWHTPEVITRRIANTNYQAIGDKLKKYINQYDLEGNFIQQFHGTAEAAKYLSCSPNSIANACNGYTKTLKKYIWKYAG
jgi:hypothetical protein